VLPLTLTVDLHVYAGAFRHAAVPVHHNIRFLRRVPSSIRSDRESARFLCAVAVIAWVVPSLARTRRGARRSNFSRGLASWRPFEAQSRRDAFPGVFYRTAPCRRCSLSLKTLYSTGCASFRKAATIAIDSRRNRDRLEVVVRNSGPCPTSAVAAHKDGRNGIGLANPVERLKTLYGDDHRFTLQWPEAGGCQVTIELPFKTTTQNPEEATCAR
jgi:hypothetical protein